MAKKLGCASCGGTKKMKLGGSAVAKAPVNMYGIPQENMGTSSQMGFGRKGGVVKKPLVKAQSGRTVKTYKNTPYSKETIVSKSSKGSMIYEADKKGNVTSLKPSTGSMISMDTTGYAAGKKSFPLKSTGMISSKTTNVPRSKVKSTIDDMKKEVKSFRKMGGATKKPLMKAQKGTTVKTKAIPNDVYKRDSTNYSNAANKYLNATTKKDYNEGRDSLNAIKTRYGTPNDLEKRMKRTVGGYDLKKKGGAVKSKKK